MRNTLLNSCSAGESARGLALLKTKTAGNANTYRSLSYKEMKSMSSYSAIFLLTVLDENNKDSSYNVTFIPKTEGVFKATVKLVWA
jgi:hypothetical protein